MININLTMLSERCKDAHFLGISSLFFVMGALLVHAITGKILSNDVQTTP